MTGRRKCETNFLASHVQFNRPYFYAYEAFCGEARSSRMSER